MVFPHFDYRSPVWCNFALYHHNSLQILHNQDFIIDMSSMEELIWVTLDTGWKHQLLLVAFKSLKQMVLMYMPSFTFIHSTDDINTRSHFSNT